MPQSLHLRNPHPKQNEPSAFPPLGLGPLVTGAVSYSLYIFRLSELGAKGLSTDLTQAVKTFVLAGLYLIWTGVDAAAVLAKGGSLLSMWPNWTSTLAWGILAYSAIVPGALADIMQARADLCRADLRACAPARPCQSVWSFLPCRSCC